MHVTYGFVFYFTIFVSILNVSMLIFVFRPIRRIMFNFLKRHHILENYILASVLYIIYAIIFIILADSVWTYWTLKNMMQSGNLIVTQSPPDSS